MGDSLNVGHADLGQCWCGESVMNIQADEGILDVQFQVVTQQIVRTCAAGHQSEHMESFVLSDEWRYYPNQQSTSDPAGKVTGRES